MIDNKVVIIDNSNTGEYNHGSRWNNFIHEFVELKSNIPNRKSKTLIAKKTVPSFFDDYKENHRIIGITGTLGSQSNINFLQTTYTVECVHFPRSCVSR